MSNVQTIEDQDDEVLASQDEQLKAKGLRSATTDEAGWYVTLVDEDDNGRYGYKVWATDLPRA